MGKYNNYLLWVLGCKYNNYLLFMLGGKYNNYLLYIHIYKWEKQGCSTEKNFDPKIRTTFMFIVDETLDICKGCN